MIDHDLERERARATIDAAKAAIQVPTLVGGIVNNYDPSTGIAAIKLDGDPPDVSTPVPSLLDDPLHVSQRVQVLQYPPNGAAVIGTSAASRCGLSTMRTGTQAFSTGVEATITWQSNTYDSDAFMPTPGTTITIPAGLGGLYAFVCKLNVGAAAGFDYVRFILSNLGSFYAPVNSATVQQAATLGAVPLADGETIQVAGRVAANVTATPKLWMHRVGP